MKLTIPILLGVLCLCKAAPNPAHTTEVYNGDYTTEEEPTTTQTDYENIHTFTGEHSALGKDILIGNFLYNERKVNEVDFGNDEETTTTRDRNDEETTTTRDTTTRDTNDEETTTTRDTNDEETTTNRDTNFTNKHTTTEEYLIPGINFPTENFLYNETKESTLEELHPSDALFQIHTEATNRVFEAVNDFNGTEIVPIFDEVLDNYIPNIDEIESATLKVFQPITVNVFDKEISTQTEENYVIAKDNTFVDANSETNVLSSTSEEIQPTSTMRVFNSKETDHITMINDVIGKENILTISTTVDDLTFDVESTTEPTIDNHESSTNEFPLNIKETMSILDTTELDAFLMETTSNTENIGETNKITTTEEILGTDKSTQLEAGNFRTEVPFVLINTEEPTTEAFVFKEHSLDPEFVLNKETESDKNASYTTDGTPSSTNTELVFTVETDSLRYLELSNVTIIDDILEILTKDTNNVETAITEHLSNTEIATTFTENPVTEEIIEIFKERFPFSAAEENTVTGQKDTVNYTESVQVQNNNNNMKEHTSTTAGHTVLNDIHDAIKGDVLRNTIEDDSHNKHRNYNAKRRESKQNVGFDFALPPVILSFLGKSKQ